MADENTDVIICGCGPTGALLSVLLAQLNVRSVCLDKEPEIVTDPRGIALDEDGIRALQAAGILDQIYASIGRCMGLFNFVGGVHSDLHQKPFMTMDYGTSEGGTGHVEFICHKQPALEKCLRQRIDSEACADLRPSSTVVSIEQDSEKVIVVYEDIAGARKHLSGKYLVGADGKTGYTRKRYLEAKGIRVEKISPKDDYAETWVAVNLKLKLPTPETHPDFPLWSKEYSSEDVYDAFFPSNFRFLCNPTRPAVCGRFGLPGDRLWRFEYVVRLGEDKNTMASMESVRKIVFPYLHHSGQRYGLSANVSFPEDCITVLRSRPFFFSARSCNAWSHDRVILCGDAAHVFPPFGGQGIASGFRDVLALAWRLKLASTNFAKAHEALFKGWYMERKQQLEKSLAATAENGRYVTESNPWRVWYRNTSLAVLQMLPSWKRWFEQGSRKDGLCRYNFVKGLHFSDVYSGGKVFPQVYCRRLCQDQGPVMFTDEFIFPNSGNRGIFQLVVVLGSMEQLALAKSEIQEMDVDVPEEIICLQEAKIIVEDTRASYPQLPADTACNVVRIATATEFAASPLCAGRPEPRYYDERRIGKEFSGKYVIVRPDRFVFAACEDSRELQDALALIELILRAP